MEVYRSRLCENLVSSFSGALNVYVITAHPRVRRKSVGKFALIYASRRMFYAPARTATVDVITRSILVNDACECRPSVYTKSLKNIKIK